MPPAVAFSKMSFLPGHIERRFVKVLNDMIQEDDDPPKRQLFELKLSLLEDIGWDHLLSYEAEWMHVRFPVALPLF
ncbi:hypothetical protein MLD38_008984 [Melastoma candidum]|uniref:Uncharacterized protein n=1 Tax=Melastoma candidum TaxID=119954 RepID=A0ACB9RZ53_9MYRT|nr:hypothetical protein MLD38_008984 [Melastoma candidum]